MSDYISQLSSIQQSNAQVVSTYFSSLNTSSTANNSTSNMFGVLSNLKDYSLIQSGAYTKLMRAYYTSLEKTDTKQTSKTEKSDTDVSTDTTTVTDSLSKTDTTENIAAVKNSAKQLQESVQALDKESLFQKVSTNVTAETGEETVTQDYDWDQITSSTKEFVASYNKLIDDAAQVNATSLLRPAVWLTNITASNENALSKVGITIKEDNTLELDTAKLKEADISNLKSLFLGNNSYGDKVAYKAANIYHLADNMAQTMNTGGDRTYTATGTYAASVSGGLYDSTL